MLVKSFYGRWANLWAFSQKYEKLNSINVWEWVQCFAKTLLFCYHLLRRVAQTTDFLAEMIETDFNRCLGKTHPLCNHSKTSGANHGFFHRQMWKMHFNQCMRMGSNFKPKRIISAFILWHVAQKADFFTEIAKTQALHNHFTACSPNFRLFCRKAKNGLKSIYANESNI